MPTPSSVRQGTACCGLLVLLKGIYEHSFLAFKWCTSIPVLVCWVDVTTSQQPKAFLLCFCVCMYVSVCDQITIYYEILRDIIVYTLKFYIAFFITG